MPDWFPTTTEETVAYGLWALVLVTGYYAVLCTLDVGSKAYYRFTIHRDLEAFQDRYDRDIASLHTRLDNAGAPGVYVMPPDTAPTEVIVVQQADSAGATDAALAELRAAAGLRRPTDTQVFPAVRPTQDRPRPYQYPAPTRPDFARIRDVPPPQPKPGLAPVFVAPGTVVEYQESTDDTPETYGRHAAQ
jgi:hypothetical protein